MTQDEMIAEMQPRDGESPAALQMRVFDLMRDLYPDNPAYSDESRRACVLDAEMMQGLEEHMEDFAKRVLATFTHSQRILWFALARHIHAIEGAGHAKGFAVHMPGKFGGHHSTEWL